MYGTTSRSTNERTNERTNGSSDAYLAFPTDFAGADDIITNLAKERKLGIEIIEALLNFDYY